MKPRTHAAARALRSAWSFVPGALALRGGHGQHRIAGAAAPI